MRRERRAPRGPWLIFRWPLAIGIVSVVGLTAALVGDGWYDVVSWLTLGIVTLLMVVAWRGGPVRQSRDGR